ncbi:MAG: DUF599 domain-containing protein [Oleiphilaceae bacterium]|nr:DUF599 domain-containing protein [Oleiphilaceae bacterium]
MQYLDFIALAWFFACWIGYTHYSRIKARNTPCLSSILDLYRQDWMRVMIQRENKMSDASIIGNLERNGAFFASSCLLILAGILTALGYTQQVIEVFDVLPYSSTSSRWVWELKLGVLLVLFIYAFFKFTWSVRLYNFVSVLVGSSPSPESKTVSPRSREALAAHSASICSQAGDAFNLGLRSFYYALAVVGWFIHPIVLILSSTVVVYVLYHREFRSQALKSLQSGKVFENKNGEPKTGRGKAPKAGQEPT